MGDKININIVLITLKYKFFFRLYIHLLEQNKIGLTYLKICLKNNFFFLFQNFRQSYLNQTILYIYIYIILHLRIQRGSFITSKACLSYYTLTTLYIRRKKKKSLSYRKGRGKKKDISFHFSEKE